MEDYDSIDIDAIMEYILKDREKVIVKENYELYFYKSKVIYLGTCQSLFI